MKELLVTLLIFGVVAFSLINLKPKEVVKEVKVVPRTVVKERVVVKEIVEKPKVVYRTVNHYRTRRTAVYYRLPESEPEPEVQPAVYRQYEPVKEEVKTEKPEVEVSPKTEEPHVKMFFVKSIREPLWTGGN
ncbi:MAG: hypothetical protein M0022_02115 [Desulfobacteraceae bacterium]|nr:hypothetical protein [Desulfobacteraceae bacterium]